jgi:hypothetical membrane protein
MSIIMIILCESDTALVQFSKKVKVGILSNFISLLQINLIGKFGENLENFQNISKIFYFSSRLCIKINIIQYNLY